MKELKCLSVDKKYGKTTQYILQDKNDGSTIMWSADILKEHIRRKLVTVSNLTLTVDNKLRMHKEGVTPTKSTKQRVKRQPNIVLETEESAKKLVAKAKLMKRCEIHGTNMHGHWYYVEKTAKHHIIYIPDNVTYIETNYNSLTHFLEKKKGYVQVIGGRGLVVTYRLFHRSHRNLTIDITYLHTDKVNNMEEMFCDCKSEIVGLEHLNTSNVKTMRGMFEHCKAEKLDLSHFDTRQVKDMISMFMCTETEILDLSSFNTSNVESMVGMFRGCDAHIINVSSFNTSKVTNMQEMFENCAVNNLDLRNFDTQNVEVMDSMFAKMKTHILDLSSFNTENVITMSFMFYECQADYIDIRSFNISKCTETMSMFSKCRVGTIMLKDIVKHNCPHMECMFEGCTVKEWDFTAVKEADTIEEVVDYGFFFCFYKEYKSLTTIKLPKQNKFMKKLIETQIKDRAKLILV